MSYSVPVKEVTMKLTCSNLHHSTEETLLFISWLLSFVHLPLSTKEVIHVVRH